MLLLFDIGNTNTHLGLANDARVLKQASVPTRGWFDGSAGRRVEHFTRNNKISGVALCSVVPRATPRVRRLVKQRWRLKALELTPGPLSGVGVDYPRPQTIGPDRPANAFAVPHHFCFPPPAVDFSPPPPFALVQCHAPHLSG